MTSSNHNFGQEIAFAQLQRRIGDLPQELIHMIFLELMRLCLRPGKIFLNEYGKAYAPLAEKEKDKQRPEKRYDKPDLSIVLALNKNHLGLAADMLYNGNVFVMPRAVGVSDRRHQRRSEARRTERAFKQFFQRWYRQDIRLLPSIELQTTGEDMHLWYCNEPTRFYFYTYYDRFYNRR